MDIANGFDNEFFILTRKKPIARIAFALLAALPFMAMAAVWLTPLAFVPVPWPDDSAFYFVAKDFFAWPPRWVMMPQAPFEPSYAIFNFNTMPLYPLLVGLGRLIGIDGSFGIKFWPLVFWALSGSLAVLWLGRKGLSLTGCAAVALLFSLDPAMRWASNLVRPESLIGLCGTALVLGLTLGFPARWGARGLWDPVAALLAVAAYAHFNAIHLVLPVIAAFVPEPRKLLKTGARTILYLLPWIATVLMHPGLFIKQMQVQWLRLEIRSEWLDSVPEALASLFQTMGSPFAWHPSIKWAAVVMWVLIFLAFAWVAVENLFIPAYRTLRQALAVSKHQKYTPAIDKSFSLLPSCAWLASAIWLWDSKPELWFVFYLHVSLWTFAGLALLKLSKHRVRRAALVTLLFAASGVFLHVNVFQLHALRAERLSWRWSEYYKFVDCIDARLKKLEADLGHPKPMRAWFPTFPDVTVELSRRHPAWQFTRTNDFHDRIPLAMQHGRDVEAVVVTETLGWEERTVSSPMQEVPEIRSVWMDWQPYFLSRFLEEKSWKPVRHICQRGRWTAFMYME
ncbi:MAG: hypothetical protein A2583_04410 [Bdellovibrionales bacterium RIFOXYD1_FULL_53_11]|nr:MAG: hypothetical protein A2583_04410 [Bdellovibrionales bacterium RIFOXYD1_FULL_53_11]